MGNKNPPPNKLNLIPGDIVGECIFVAEAGTIFYTHGSMRACVFRCQCGKLFTKPLAYIRQRKITSCGCGIVKIKNKSRPVRYTNGIMSPELNAWYHIKARCYNKKDKSYARYGGRGIVVCDKWLNSFDCFLSDMGPRPTKFHSIDRINVNGNYEPSNCRWATRLEQANNKRNNIYYLYNGESLTINEWGRRINVKPATLLRRISSGYPLERVFTSAKYDNRGRLILPKLKLQVTF